MLVFLVVVAIELLDMGDAGVGYLNSAFGVGALVGAIGALGLTGARRLSPGFLVGLLLWGLPLAVLGMWSSVAVALVLFAVMGAGNSLVDVAGYTLVQRAVPDEVLARVFGVLQFFLLSALGIGGVLAPVLSDLFGLDTALIVSGLFLPVLVLLFGRRWRRSTHRRPRRRRRSCDCSPASRSSRRSRAPSLEHIAGRLVPVRIEPGTVVVREGDAGDRFYVIVEGEVEVSAEGKPVVDARDRAATSARSRCSRTCRARRRSRRRRRSCSTRSSARTSSRR